MARCADPVCVSFVVDDGHTTIQHGDNPEHRLTTHGEPVPVERASEWLARVHLYEDSRRASG